MLFKKRSDKFFVSLNTLQIHNRSINAQLPAFGSGRELVFSIGAEEAQATLTAGGNVQFNNLNHLAQLSAEDYFSIRFYQNSDMVNVLWEYNFYGLDVRSSGDLRSRAAQSFLIRPTEQAIEVALAIEVKPTDTIQWEVVALKGNDATDDLNGESNGGSGPTNKPFAYGKTMSHKVGPVQAITSATGINVNAQGQIQMGKYREPWLSQEYTGSAAKVFSFRPDMSDEPHLPTTYRGATTTGQPGTRHADVWRRNPRVGYKVKAIVNGQQVGSAEIRMDEVDVMRQEYVNHLASTNTQSPTAAQKGVRVLDRDQLVLRNTLPTGEWVDSNYPYQRVVNDGMLRLSNDITSHFASYRNGPFSGLLNTDFDLPTNAIRITSSYRNPERNERVGGASGSRHMMGRAVDFGFEALPVLPANATLTQQLQAYNSRGILFGRLWQMNREHHADWLSTANYAQLEGRGGPSDVQVATNGCPAAPSICTITSVSEGSQDADNDDIPDEYELTFHYHVQDNPAP